jgi:hypothetical protein
MEVIKPREELLDRSANRELRERKAAFWQGQVETGMSLLQSYLPPIIAYATQGNAGVREGVTAFATSLDMPRRDALFGEWNGAQLVKPGVLSEEQATWFSGIVGGNEPPSRVADFIATISPEQMAIAHQILRQDQLVGLMAVADAVKKAATDRSAGREVRRDRR